MMPGSEQPLDLILKEPNLIRLPDTGVPDWLVMLGFGTALFALGVLMVWRTARRGNAQPSIQYPVSPLRTALDALTRLKRSHPSTRHEIDRFYVTLSRIVRRFVQDRFGIPALKKTSDETFNALCSRNFLPEEAGGRFEKLLACADRVKFAGFCASLADPKNDLLDATRLVEDLAASAPEKPGSERSGQRREGP